MTRTNTLLTLLAIAACTACAGNKPSPSPAPLPPSSSSPIEAACEAGTATSCLVAASSAERDPEAAARWYLRACELGAYEGCAYAGNLLGEAQRFDEARTAFARGCDGDDGPSCYGAGLHAAGGYGDAQDFAAARVHYRRACELGVATACGQLAELIGVGHGGPVDPDEALRLQHVACDGGDGSACKILGLVAWRTDQAAALQLVERACVAELPDVDGCAYFGYFVWSAEGSTEQARGLLTMESACEAGSAEGCGARAIAHAVDGESAESEQLLGRACDIAPHHCERYRQAVADAAQSAE